MNPRLAISNIAWDAADEVAVVERMSQAGLPGVELAPTLVWKDPLAATPDDLRVCRELWAARGFQIVALQSLLFGQPHLQLFDPATRDELRVRLERMIDIASGLGARVLVFGSPKNRRRGSLSEAEALSQAVPFFRHLGDYAAGKGAVLCIESNPTRYECDFVTTAAAGAQLVEQVGSPGFGLHLDAAGMYLAGDDLPASIQRYLPLLQHFHLSAPDLGPVLTGGAVDYAAAIGALRAGGYQHWVSVEMRSQGTGADAVEKVSTTLRQLAALVEA